MNTAVGLVETYLRLNGYFTATEYQVQHPVPGQPGKYETATDLDILAIRLPWAAETVLRHPARPGELRCEVLLANDPALAPAPDLPDVLIGEVKEGAAELNRRLKTSDVLYAALRRLGCCPEEHIANAARALLERGEFVLRHQHGVACRIRLASFCGHADEEHPLGVLTITLRHMVRFIQDRLTAYRSILRSAQFGDPLLNLLKLMEKMEIGLAFGPPAPPQARDRRPSS